MKYVIYDCKRHIDQDLECDFWYFILKTAFVVNNPSQYNQCEFIKFLCTKILQPLQIAKRPFGATNCQEIVKKILGWKREDELIRHNRRISIRTIPKNFGVSIESVHSNANK